MIAKPLAPTLTVEEYFAIEAVENERRYEYIDGELFDMTGGTNNHSAIKLNIAFALGMQLRESRSDCFLRNSDMRVKVSPTRYVYPDLSAFRRQPLLENNETTLLNPILMVEVTSPSTRSYDRDSKREFYSSIPTVQAYLIVDQHRVSVDLHTRMDERWLWQTFDDLQDVVYLEALGCALPMTEIYRGVTFS